MKRLAVMLLLTIVTVRCLGATASAAEPAEKLLGDSQYWSTFAWDNPEKSRLFTSIPWSPPEMKRSPGFTYSFRVSLDGVPLVLYALRKSADTGQFGEFDLAYSSFDKKESAAHLNRLRQWCTANFGDRSAQVDNVKRVYKVQSFSTSYTYWLKGTTLIRLAVSDGVDNGKPVYLGRISYLDARYNRVRSPEKMLTCELDMRSDKELATVFPEKTVYKVDEADSLIKDLTDNVVSEDVVSTDTVLKFSKQSGTMLKVHDVNKSTGEYRFSLFNSANTSRRTPDIVINGKCTLGELPRKLF